MAMALARHFAAELLGVTLESEALLRAATLPFATEVSREGGIERRLDAAALEKRLARAARQLHETLLSQALAAGLTARVHSRRGRLPAVLQDCSVSADILVISRVPESRWRTAGSPVRLESPNADTAGFDAVAQALHTWTAAEPWERLPWLGDAEALLRLQRRRPALVLAGPEALTEPQNLQRLIDALDCPVVVLR